MTIQLMLQTLAVMAAIAGPKSHQHFGCTPNTCEKPYVVVVSPETKFKRHMRKVVKPYRAKLIRMAWCESTNQWHINTGNGFQGGLQFTPSTWQSVGGTGTADQASKLEQMYRAVLLIRRAGFGPWPICGYR